MPSFCKQCQAPFEVTAEDRGFYEKISPVIAGQKYLLPPPTLCPLCRQQRRQARRNERKLYNRKCSATGKQIISLYDASKPFQVYEGSVWWSDQFDGKQYGREYDFGRSFFAQWQDLQLAVPRIALFTKGNENSDYTNHADHLKDCYLVMNGGLASDCYYGNWIVYAINCIDCSYIENCELCYQTSYSNNCYNTRFVSHCENCSDSSFLYDCKGVKNCLLSVNLRNQQYCILNQQYSKEAYEEKLAAINFGSYREMQELQKQFQALLLQMPHRAQFVTNCEDCVGQNIMNSKNCHSCFYLHNSQDAKYCYNTLNITDAYDVYESGIECEMQIETHACNRSKFVGFCSSSYENSTIWYCDLTHNSKDLFGCIGLKGAQYCILNKQYTKEQYEQLVPQIIAHMQASGEWGEFFPIAASPFAYNETLAQEVFPLSEGEIVALGGKYQADGATGSYQGEVVQLPDQITEVDDTLLEKILTCTSCSKHYRIIRQELSFYREQSLPLPRTCIDCRHRERTKESTLITMKPRPCARCHKVVETTYPESAPEIIYCEECYLSTVY